MWRAKNKKGACSKDSFAGPSRKPVVTIATPRQYSRFEGGYSTIAGCLLDGVNHINKQAICKRMDGEKMKQDCGLGYGS
jgi:hypothetical protein